MTENIASYMEQVVTHYWGEPDAKRGHEWRWGNKGGRSVDMRKGTWFDFETNEGGGVVDLVKRSEGAGLGSVASVLQRKFGIAGPQAEKLRPREWLSKVYDYFDADGELRYQVLRYEPRRFLQRRPNGDGWVYRMEGVEPLPYRLPDLLANPQAPVFIVEGEKCADILAKHGLVATTSHGGAGKWREPLNQFFKDRRVIVLPDNDEPGARHADLVIEQLFPIAKEIKRVELQGLPAKGDVADWFAMGRDLTGLKQACKVAPVIAFLTEKKSEISEQNPSHIYETDEENNSSGTTVDVPIDVFPTLTLDQVCALPPVEWLVEGMLTRTGLGVLYGPPGAGKSFAALDMALSVARGQSFHGAAVTGGPVLYIAGEGVGGLGKRIKALKYARKWHGEAPLHVLPASVAFAEQGEVERLFRTIDALGDGGPWALVIVDTVARALLGHEENSADSMGLFIAACDAVKRHTGGALLGIHHAGKDAARGMRGSSALLGAVDTSIKAAQEYGFLSLTVEKQKDAEAQEPWRFRMTPRGIIGDTSVVLERVEGEARARVKLSATQYLALQCLRNLMVELKAQKIPATRWHDAHARDCPDESSQARSAARNALHKRGLVVITDGLVWPSPESDKVSEGEAE